MVDYRCNPESVRTQAIQNALKEYNAATGDHDTWPVPWKGDRKSFPVIRVGLENLALNHRSHRIRAQLEDLPDAQKALEEPDGKEAQEYIALAILEVSEHFDDLSADLDRLGQTEPGVVTRKGVLVNGNRRAVALRELGQKWMRVALLPPGVSSTDLDDLEFDLQVVKELREDYTFTNRLIVINELLESRRESTSEVALRLGWARSKEPGELKKGERRVDQATRVLSMIRTLQGQSHHKGHALRLKYFDDKQQSLEELDTILLKLEENGEEPGTIESLKNLRLTGMLAGQTKLQLRRILPGFGEEFLKPRLDDDDAEPIKGMLSVGSAISPGAIPGLTGPADHGASADPTPEFLIALAKSVALEEAGESGSDDPISTDVRDKLAEVMGDAIEVAGSTTSKANRLRAPIESLRKARRAAESARKQLLNVMSDTRFKAGDVSYQLKKLEKESATIRELLESGGAQTA